MTLVVLVYFYVASTLDDQKLILVWYWYSLIWNDQISWLEYNLPKHWVEQNKICLINVI